MTKVIDRKVGMFSLIGTIGHVALYYAEGSELIVENDAEVWVTRTWLFMEFAPPLNHHPVEVTVEDTSCGTLTAARNTLYKAWEEASRRPRDEWNGKNLRLITVNSARTGALIDAGQFEMAYPSSNPYV